MKNPLTMRFQQPVVNLSFGDSTVEHRIPEATASGDEEMQTSGEGGVSETAWAPHGSDPAAAPPAPLACSQAAAEPLHIVLMGHGRERFREMR